MPQEVTSTIIIIFCFLTAITVHEFSHAWVANYLGDDTAKMAGRMTLNPIKHIDLWGLLAIVLIGIGWAKPVPVNYLKFKNARVGNFLVSLAGPFSNFVLALLFAGLYKVLPVKESLFSLMLILMVQINLILMVLNLLPLPPLDGSKVFLSILPLKNYHEALIKVESMFVFSIIILILFGRFLIIPAASFLMNFMGIPLNYY